MANDEASGSSTSEAEETAADGDHAQGRPGCLAQISLYSGILLAIGIYLTSRWESLHTGARVGAIILIVLGTLGLVPALLVLGFRIFLKTVAGSAIAEVAKASKGLARMGENIVRDGKAMYGQIHEFRNASEEDFEGLDRAYYESAARQLSEAGFRHLGDVVDATIEQLGKPSPVIRIMASADATTRAGLYHLNLPRRPNFMKDLEGKSLHFCDLATEFSDGTQQMTANTEGLNLMTTPPKLHHRQFPLDTPIAVLLAEHEAERAKLLAGKADARCVPFNTLDDALESERRQQAIKNAFRKGIGYADPAEAREIARRSNYDEDFADRAAVAVDQARREDGREEEK